MSNRLSASAFTQGGNITFHTKVKFVTQDTGENDIVSYGELS